jgi:hypothetical protein
MCSLEKLNNIHDGLNSFLYAHTIKLMVDSFQARSCTRNNCRKFGTISFEYELLHLIFYAHSIMRAQERGESNLCEKFFNLAKSFLSWIFMFFQPLLRSR